jgi:hypothetical protein
MNAIAPQRTALDIISEYEEKDAAVADAVKAFEDAKTAIETAGCVMGTYVGSAIDRGYVHESHLRSNLLKSGWKALYNRLQIERIASANDKRLFERTIEAPPPLTLDNARATFGPYLENPRQHILRGLAETFAGLDPAYRSHSKVKIGVKGLPKRVIISGFGGYGSYGRDKVRDIAYALAAYRGEPLVDHDDFAEVDKLHAYFTASEGEADLRGLKVRKFKNGNAHVIFDEHTLLDINRGLAEFYGDVLPDVDPDAPEKAPSTAVAKDLQFYWTPDAAIDAAMEFAGVWNLPEWRYNPPAPLRILEPSCGDGRILDALRKRGHISLGIEYHAGRAAQAKAKGHSVVTGNFLEQPPRAEFDTVVMNPPFFGKLYMRHVKHAFAFLKPGGVLVSILPATAKYDHGLIDKDFPDGVWRDLPVGSFSEAGTNVTTGMLKVVKHA